MAATRVARKTSSKSANTSPLAHLIPDSRFAPVPDGDYISRSIGGHADISILRYAKKAKSNVLLAGPTGPGKTSLVMAYCAEDQIPLVTIQCNGAVDPNSFWGGLSIREDGTLSGFQDSEPLQVIESGGVLYLDEINMLHPKVAAVFHMLLDKRRQVTILEKGNQVINAHPNLQVIGAYNPDYEGTRPLNPAFKNRFRIKLFFDYDREVEQELVCVPKMLEVASKLRNAQRDGRLDTPCSTNMLIEFEELAVDLGYDFALQNFLNAYNADERPAVVEVMDVHSVEIKEQVDQMLALEDDD